MGKAKYAWIIGLAMLVLAVAGCSYNSKNYNEDALFIKFNNQQNNSYNASISNETFKNYFEQELQINLDNTGNVDSFNLDYHIDSNLVYLKIVYKPDVSSKERYRTVETLAATYENLWYVKYVNMDVIVRLVQSNKRDDSDAIRIDPLIIEKFEFQDEVRVSVILMDDLKNLSCNGSVAECYSLYEIKAEHYLKLETDVLSSLSEDHFRLVSKSTLIPAFSGYITEKGVEKLKSDPRVVAIEASREVYLT